MRAKKPCSIHKNILLSAGERCGKCQRAKRNKDKAQKKAKGPRLYDKQIWRGEGGIRQRKLMASPLCERCKEQGYMVNGEHVDHRDGNTDNNQDENLRTLCASCHSQKTVHYDGGFGRKKRQ